MTSDRSLAMAALVISVVALVFSMTGVSEAVRKRAFPGASTKPQPYGVLRLNKHRKFPAARDPEGAPRAQRADRLGGKRAEDLTRDCAPEHGRLRHLVPDERALRRSRTTRSARTTTSSRRRSASSSAATCRPPAQLIGAAPRVKLASTIDDSQLSASIDLDPTDGMKDRREMSATLSRPSRPARARRARRASPRARKGDPEQGEPDPVPLPANPQPGDAPVRDRLRQPRQGRLRGLQAGQPAGALPLRVRQGPGSRSARGGSRCRPVAPASAQP